MEFVAYDLVDEFVGDDVKGDVFVDEALDIFESALCDKE